MTNLLSYDEFILSKRTKSISAGFDDNAPDYLYPFQRVLFDRSCKRGRSAVFADCGLGKTPLQLAWSNAVAKKINGKVLIITPLAVAEQTAREGVKFGVECKVCRSADDVASGVNVTNFEMLHKFSPNMFHGVVLDESSILKSFSGSVRNEITQFVKHIPYRIACSATPAPNDYIEILNHSDFLDVMSVKEAIALFFKQDGNTTHKWRIKRHAERDWWAWLASWATACRNPIDLGFRDSRFELPPLRTHQHIVDGHTTDGYLFPVEAVTLDDQRKASRETVLQRAEMAAALVNQNTRPWIVWCFTNSEADALRKQIPDAVEIRGSDEPEKKAERLLGFSDQKYRVLITKPSIAGWGLNWQHCADMAFVGLSHSYEQYYQAVRRCWRFGQSYPVNAHIICTENDGAILSNIERKERECAEMMRQLVKHINTEYAHRKDDGRYKGKQLVSIPKWIA